MKIFGAVGGEIFRGGRVKNILTIFGAVDWKIFWEYLEVVPRGEWEGENGCRHPVMAAHTAPYIHSTSRQIYENTCIYVYI